MEQQRCNNSGWMYLQMSLMTKRLLQISVRNRMGHTGITLTNQPLHLKYITLELQVHRMDALIWQGLNPIKLAYIKRWPDSWLRK